MKLAGVLVLSSVLWLGCVEETGQQTSEVINDTSVMREAVRAANDVIRNATDCDLVRSAAPEVYRKLDEAEAKIQTTTGRTSLRELSRQVKNVADACGA